MSQEKTKYCYKCGTMIPYYERYCPACNAPQPVLPDMEPIGKKALKKKVWTAVLLSFLVTGLGQYYLGRHWRALAFFGGTLVTGMLLSLFLTKEQVMFFGLAMAIASSIDAYMLASSD